MKNEIKFPHEFLQCQWRGPLQSCRRANQLRGEKAGGSTDFEGTARSPVSQQSRRRPTHKTVAVGHYAYQSMSVTEPSRINQD